MANTALCMQVYDIAYFSSHSRKIRQVCMNTMLLCSRTYPSSATLKNQLKTSIFVFTLHVGPMPIKCLVNYKQQPLCDAPVVSRHITYVQHYFRTWSSASYSMRRTNIVCNAHISSVVIFKSLTHTHDGSSC